MKTFLKRFLQRILGIENYLFWFAIFVILTLRFRKQERGFMHFLRMIPREGTILDIGANIGVMTYYLARRNRESKVYAFEPVPFNLVTLRRIVRFFGLRNVLVFDNALGNDNGIREMVVPVQKGVRMQGLSHVVDPSIREFNEGEKVRIPIRTLDSVEELAGEPRISAIKMDVENFEYFVLQGGINLITKHRPLICTELWDNENRQKCLEFIRGLGYRVMVVNGGKLEPFDKDFHQTQNFIFSAGTDLQGPGREFLTD